MATFLHETMPVASGALDLREQFLKTAGFVTGAPVLLLLGMLL